MISGTGFTEGAKVKLTAQFPLQGGNSLTVTKSATAGSDGSWKALAFRVPWQAKDGDVTLTVTGARSSQASAVTLTLRVAHQPFVILDSGKVSAGQNVVAEILGFAPNESITLASTIRRSNGGKLNLRKVVKVGNRGFGRASLHLTNNTEGARYVLTAFGSTLRLRAAAQHTVTAIAPKPTPRATATSAPKATATAQPSHAGLTVAPRSVIPGTNAQIIGEGFSANTKVSITASISRGNATPQKVDISATLNGKGGFSAILHVPGDATAGGYTVTATGGGRLARATLHIAYLRTLVVSVPARAIPGTTITVTGFGFASGASVTVTLGGQTLGKGSANAAGTFKTQCTVPGSMATGMQSLVAQDTSGRKASFSVQVYRKIATHF